MRTPEIINLILLAISGIFSAYKIGDMLYKATHSKHIKIIRKDTGRSVTVSRAVTKQDIHNVAELVK